MCVKSAAFCPLVAHVSVMALHRNPSMRFMSPLGAAQNGSEGRHWAAGCTLRNYAVRTEGVVRCTDLKPLEANCDL